jgi:N-methylhydantoinase B
MFISNDPYSGGGTHLPDITMVAPAFVEKSLVGFVASIAHHADVGGKVPGSTSGDATSIFQEGIRIPLIQIAELGNWFRMLLTSSHSTRAHPPNARAT